MSEDQSASLSVVLQAISVEISRLADLMEPLEVALESSFACNDAGRSFRQIFQNFDLHSQSVETLANMLQALAAKIPIDVQIDPTSAIENIHLQQIRSRLKSSLESIVECAETSDLHAENIQVKSCSPVEVGQNIELF